MFFWPNINQFCEGEVMENKEIKISIVINGNSIDLMYCISRRS